MENVSQMKINMIAPKVYAQKCPVCNGFGTVRYGEVVCPGCLGKGYILVPTEMEGMPKYEK